MAITAGEMMTTQLITLSADMNLVEMDTVLIEERVSGAPVVDRMRLIGVASQADIIRAIWEDHHESYKHASYYSSPFPVPISALDYISRDAPQLGNQLVEQRVRDIMTSDPQVAHPGDSLDAVAARMLDDQIHRLPITDPENGNLMGIITSLDLVRAIRLHGLNDGT